MTPALVKHATDDRVRELIELAFIYKIRKPGLPEQWNSIGCLRWALAAVAMIDLDKVCFVETRQRLVERVKKLSESVAEPEKDLAAEATAFYRRLKPGRRAGKFRTIRVRFCRVARRNTAAATSFPTAHSSNQCWTLACSLLRFLILDFRDSLRPESQVATRVSGNLATLATFAPARRTRFPWTRSCPLPSPALFVVRAWPSPWFNRASTSAARRAATSSCPPPHPR